MQNSMNLMYREEEREMVPFTQHAGIGLIPWGPLNAGRLARPLDSEDTIRTSMYKQVGLMTESESEDEIVRRVTKLSQDKGWTMAQVSLAWIWDKVTSPIVGVSSVCTC
jgi:aryl-alcohol dehydrogenase-like predicted oxidoreductase